MADDTEAMVGAARALGARCEVSPEEASIVVEGHPGGNETREILVDCRMSGTTARFLTPVLAARASPAVIDGHEQMRARPMGDLVAALRRLGAEVEALDRPDHLPIRVRGPLRGDEVALPGDVSSQFVSGLMLAGPLSRSGLTISLTTEAVSRPYIDMTTAVMRSFGADVERVGQSTWRVAGGGYLPAAVYRVEPDASAASYFLAAAAMTRGRVRVEGLGRSSLQGDMAFVETLQRMGASVELDEAAVEVTGRGLRGVDVDLASHSDTAPTLAVVAALADGPTTVTGIGFIRGKESDRVAGPVTELARLGVPAEETADGFVVRPSGPPTAGRVHTYEDHRMAMAFALLGLVVTGIEIEDPGCVAKTFPDYFAALDQLR